MKKVSKLKKRKANPYKKTAKGSPYGASANTVSDKTQYG